MKNYIYKNCLGVFIATLLVLSTFVNPLYAVNDPRHIDEDVISYSQVMSVENNQIQSVDAQLASIENILDENALTYTEFIAKYPEKAENVSLGESEVINSLMASDAPLGINGFFWGFCLGLLGILIVFLVTMDDPSQNKYLKNALWGCIASGLLYILLWVLFAVVLGTGAGFWWWY